MSLTGFLSYSRVNWQQSPSKSTPLSAANLNVMDAGIKNNNDMISNLRGEVTRLNSNMITVTNTWINCNGVSVYEYLTPLSATGIYSVYNLSDLPDVLKGQYITIFKTIERMLIFNQSGIFIMASSNGKWTKAWYSIKATKL